MPPSPSSDELKRAAAVEAAERVESGMRLGLGTGSTVAYFLDALGKKLREGALTDVVGVPTSLRTEEASRALGIPLATLAELGTLDLTVDGADEVTPCLDLIKGLGGALLREKMVAQASERLLIVADESKSVPTLGTVAPLPIEVVPFEHESHLDWIGDLGATPTVRRASDGNAYETDNGNFILDCRFEDGIRDPESLDHALSGRAGLVESGLFLGLATEALISGPEGLRALTENKT